MPSLPTQLRTTIETDQADGCYCLTSGSNKTITLWNPYKDLKIKTYESQCTECLDVCATQDNCKFICGGMDKTCKLIDVSSGRVLRRFKGHVGRINCVTFNDDSTVLFSGSIDSTVRIWDMKSNTNSEIQIIKDATDSIIKICVSQYEIFTASADGCVRRYDLRNGRAECDKLSTKGLSSIAITNRADKKGENYKCVFVSTLDGQHFLIDTGNGQMLAEYTVPNDSSSKPLSMPNNLQNVLTNSGFQIDNALSHDDQYAYSGSENGYIYCWDVLETTLKAKLPHEIKNLNGDGINNASKSVVSSLSCHPKQNHMLSTSANFIYLWVEKDI